MIGICWTNTMPNLPRSSGADKIKSRTDWPSYGSAYDFFHPRTDGVPNAVNLPTYLQEGPLLWPGQYARAIDSLTTITLGDVASSLSEKKRPRTSGMPITSKY